MKGTIVLWGDSIGKGVIYSDIRKRYCLAKDRCTALLSRAGLNIENNACMGQTITEGYKEYLATASRPGDIAVIEYGGNDCDLLWDDVNRDPSVFHDGKTPLPAFRETLRQFLRAAKERGQTPIAVIPPPLEPVRYYRWICQGRNAKHILDYLVDVQHIYRWHERYANAVREVALETGSPALDLRTPFLDARDLPSLICRDGIHPNEAGQRLMAETVMAFLAEHGISPDSPSLTPLEAQAC